MPQQSREHLSQVALDQSGSLTNEDVVRMLKAGQSDKTILARIGKSDCRFNTSPVALDALEKAGVPDDVVLGMVHAPAGLRANPSAELTVVNSSTEARGDSTEDTDYLGDNEALLKTTYDISMQQTLIRVYTTETGPVYPAEGQTTTPLVHSMSSGGGFVCRGQIIQCAPAAVEILFVASTSHWQFSVDRQAQVVIDGVSLDAGTFAWDGRVNGPSDLTEFLDVTASPDVLRKLAGAKRVEVRLGRFRFELIPQNIAGLAALADHLSLGAASQQP